MTPAIFYQRFISRRTTFAILFSLIIFGISTQAFSYEPTTTHTGITQKALLKTTLHQFIKHLGYKNGIFSRLSLKAAPFRAQRYYKKIREKLDSSGGYQPDDSLTQWGIGWVLAGNIIEEEKASQDRNHFFDPKTQKGLDNKKAVAGSLFSFFSMIEGGDSLRAFLTASAFNFAGKSALKWIEHPDNPYSLKAFYTHLTHAITEKTESKRQYHLAESLIAMGALLHVLQDMSSPTHVRNDYYQGHLERVGESTYLRRSSYEYYVEHYYRRNGIPEYTGKAIKRPSFAAFFSTTAQQGLADLTQRSFFSPGSIPQPIFLNEKITKKQLYQKITRSMPYALPKIENLDLSDAHLHTKYLWSNKSRLLAYRIIPKKRTLNFFLDYNCHAANARILLPLAVGFSQGFINHLLRGNLTLKKTESGFSVFNRGSLTLRGKLILVTEDDKGSRKVLSTKMGFHSAPQTKIYDINAKDYKNAKKLWVVFQGKDQANDPIVTFTSIKL